ncbi:MAG TPA: hypothetical protein PK637_01150 [Flavobacteriales bacterium]|nr:hypothetical protein [Flavobacteriales bacterium]HRE95338.1 hypothetical protein [Flavobacteriales bacterium]HRJ37260.1 hypothetical protein [Flavobacteriales bacterium]
MMELLLAKRIIFKSITTTGLLYSPEYFSSDNIQILNADVK